MNNIRLNFLHEHQLKKTPDRTKLKANFQQILRINHFDAVKKNFVVLLASRHILNLNRRVMSTVVRRPM